MGDVVSIEVDGELGEPEYDDDRDRPRWGMPAAGVVVVLMVLLLGWSLVAGSAGGDAGEQQAIVPTTATTLLASSTSAPVTSAPATTMSPEAQAGDPTSAARLALAAWGRFAATGQLEELDGSFVPDGAQLAVLRDEAQRLRPSEAPYDVSLEDPSVTISDSNATVTGDVTWVRSGEPDQLYRWEIDLLRGADGVWRLSTVRTAAA